MSIEAIVKKIIGRKADTQPGAGEQSMKAKQTVDVQISGSGVRRQDWSPSDQDRMKNGEMPKGHPEHPNV